MTDNEKENEQPGAAQGNQDQPAWAEEIYLDEDDEAALDRAWSSPEVIAAVLRDRDRRDAAEAAAARKASRENPAVKPESE